jgi:hypothetical protein
MDCFLFKEDFIPWLKICAEHFVYYNMNLHNLTISCVNLAHQKSVLFILYTSILEFINFVDSQTKLCEYVYVLYSVLRDLLQPTENFSMNFAAWNLRH